MSALVVESIGKKFGGVVAVDGLSFEAAAGTITGLIGPNGAGKTTVFNIITGLVRADQGSIRLHGADITRTPDFKIARLGVQRTFQNIRLFGRLSTLDNVAIGCLPMRSRGLEAARQTAAALLETVGFGGNMSALPGELPYAFQRRVEIARALAANPSVLLLDEPAAGMHADEREDLARLVRNLVTQGLAIVLIEHDMALVARVCHRVLVMDFGRAIALGTPEEIRNDPAVTEAYLGGAE